MEEDFVQAFKMHLNPGNVDAYRRRHDEIWPALSNALLEAGVLDYAIFLDDETSVLFAYMRCRKDHDLASLRTSELMHEWWTWMSDLMQTNPDKSPIEVGLQQIFQLSKAAEPHATNRV